MSKDQSGDDPGTETFFPGIGAVVVDDPPAGEPPVNDDDDFAPRPRYRMGALSILLVAVLVAGLGFLGGVSVGKNHASTTTATRGGTAARAGGFGGAFPGGEGFAGAAGTAGAPAAAGAAGSTTGTTSGTSTIPTVIGTVASISGQTLVVKNLGGTSVTVHMTATTTVTKTATAPALATGQGVSVYSTAATDKSVTATNITVR
jgi:hypothetical protein